MDATVTFKDGTAHTYQGVPDGTSPDVVEAQALKEFGKPVASLSGGAAPAPEAKPGILERVKNAVYVPENQRQDASLGDAVVGGITNAPAEIGKQFSENMANVENPQAPFLHGELGNKLADNSAVFRGFRGIEDQIARAPAAIGAALSPVTGTLTSVVGRPVEEATGIRREVTGNVAAALIPFGGAASEASKADKLAATINPAAHEAVKAGYVLPPNMISKKPGIVASVLSGLSGKVKTQFAASEKNQEVTNRLAATDLGLAPDAQLNAPAFQAVRADAGKAYEAVKTAVPDLKADEQYHADIDALSGAKSQAAALFPNTMGNPAIKDLAQELHGVTEYPTAAGIDLVKQLRADANTNLKAIGDPKAHALGLAQRQAADAVDGLIERNIEKSGGDPGLVQSYKDARQRIAKSYDVEGATNAATGDVNAVGLARLAQKGKPLTGGVSTIANAALAFPKAMRAGVENEPLGVLDFFGAGAASVAGRHDIAAGILSRPIARAGALSKPVQRAVLKGRSPIIPESNVVRSAPAGNALYQLSQQTQNQ